MRSWYVTQSNGAVLRKSSIRKLPTNMATEKAVTYAKKKIIADVIPFEWWKY